MTQIPREQKKKKPRQPTGKSMISLVNPVFKVSNLKKPTSTTPVQKRPNSSKSPRGATFAKKAKGKQPDMRKVDLYSSYVDKEMKGFNTNRAKPSEPIMGRNTDLSEASQPSDTFLNVRLSTEELKVF
jgi:hypothetical protein